MKQEDKFICYLSEYKQKYGRISNKCEGCGKHYKLPGSIFEPRDKICFTCELKKDLIERIKNV